MKLEPIRPGVVVDGETYYPPGWMWVLAFALKGCQWAVDIAERPEFRHRIWSLRIGEEIKDDLAEHFTNLHESQKEQQS